MGVYESGHQSETREVDHFCPGSRLKTSWPNGFNLFSSNNHNPSLVQFSRGPIKDAGGLQYVGRFSLSRAVLICREGNCEDYKNQQCESHFFDPFDKRAVADVCRFTQIIEPTSGVLTTLCHFTIDSFAPSVYLGCRIMSLVIS